MDNEIDGYASDIDLENEPYSPEKFIQRRPAYTQQSFENLSQSGGDGQNTIAYFGYGARTEEPDAIDGSAEDLEHSQPLNNASSGDSEQSWRCYPCGESFMRKDYLKRHLETSSKHNNGSKFVCPECGKLYSRPDHVKRHLKDKHGIEMELLKKMSISRAQESGST